MKSRGKILRMFLVCFALVFSQFTFAHAIPFIDFNFEAQQDQPGSLYEASLLLRPVAGTLKGSYFVLNSIQGMNTAKHEGRYFNIANHMGTDPVTGNPYGAYTVLSFTANNYPSPQPDPNGWYFGPGGSVTIRTYSLSPSDLGFDPATGYKRLMWGDVTSAAVYTLPNTSPSELALVMTFVDHKADKLQDYYGFDSDNWSGTLTLALLSNAKPGTKLDLHGSNIVSGDAVNAVPLPPTLLLLGSGLVGLVSVARRRK